MITIWTQALSVPDGLKIELETNVEYCVTSEDAVRDSPLRREAPAGFVGR